MTSPNRRHVLGGAVAGLSLAGCQLNPFDRPPADQVLRTFLADDYQTLDPIHAGVGNEADVEYVVHVFGGLMGLNDKLEPVPDLAERHTVSQDGRTYTFTLKRGARFQDGRAVTASDVKYSLERAADPANQSTAAATYLSDIAGFAERQDGKAADLRGVRVRDEQTIELTLNEARVDFLPKLAFPPAFVVDRSNVESGGARWWQRPNGTGPFKVREARPGESLVLARNETYHLARPTLSEVYFFPVFPLESYEAGQIDVGAVGIGDVEQVTDKSDPLSREVRVRTDLDLHYLGFNVAAKPFDDPKVRQAFNHALDRDKIVNVTLRRTAAKAEAILPPGMPGRSEKVKGLDFDVSRARQLIADSSYRDVRNFPEVVLSIPGSLTAPPPEVTAIAAMYKQNLGVDVRVRQIDSRSLFDQLNRNKDRFQMVWLGWIGDYPDPQNFIDLLFHSRSGENQTQYANPEVDRLIERARGERDQAARMRLYQDAEAAILNDAPIVPLWHRKRYLLVKPYVQGFSAAPLGVPWLRSVSLKSSPQRPQIGTTPGNA
jgi:oligopeptide transport system substrate-binding protein